MSMASNHNGKIKILIEIAYLKAIEWLWENKCDVLLTEEHLKRTKDKELIPCVLSVLMRIRTLEYLCIFFICGGFVGAYISCWFCVVVLFTYLDQIKAAQSLD